MSIKPDKTYETCGARKSLSFWRPQVSSPLVNTSRARSSSTRLGPGIASDQAPSVDRLSIGRRFLTRVSIRGFEDGIVELFEGKWTVAAAQLYPTVSLCGALAEYRQENSLDALLLIV
jgi:hypothetical protein